MSGQIVTADVVGLSHPDGLCDLLAERIVDLFTNFDPHAVVACQVELWDRSFHVSGSAWIHRDHEYWVERPYEALLYGVNVDGYGVVNKLKIRTRTWQFRGAKALLSGIVPSLKGFYRQIEQPIEVVGYACAYSSNGLPPAFSLCNHVFRELDWLLSPKNGGDKGRIQGAMAHSRVTASVRYEGRRPIEVVSLQLDCAWENGPIDSRTRAESSLRPGRSIE